MTGGCLKAPLCASILPYFAFQTTTVFLRVLRSVYDDARRAHSPLVCVSRTRQHRREAAHGTRPTSHVPRHMFHVLPIHPHTRTTLALEQHTNTS